MGNILGTVFIMVVLVWLVFLGLFPLFAICIVIGGWR